MMFFRLIDKLIFAAMLLAALQVPQLADHYLQYMQGYFDATADQIEGFRQNARLNGYASLDAMIDDHLQNATASVRTDAEQKIQALATFDELSEGIAIFQQGNLLQKSAWMFNPAHREMLEATMQNFVPGIPLTPMAFVFAIIVAIISNVLIASPVYVYQWRKKRKMSYRAAYKHRGASD